MRRYLPHVVTLLGLFAGPVAIVHADPIRFSLKTPVPQPDKPQLVVIADQPISDLSVAVLAKEPDPALGSASGESGEFKYQAKKLSAGQKMSFGLGSGKPGATHWEGMISAKVGGAPWKQPVTFDTVLTRTIQIGYDKNYVSPHLNVEKRFVELTLSSPAGHAEIEVFSDEGIKMGEGKASFAGEPAGTWLRIPWEGTSAAPNESVVLRLSVKLFDKDGASGHINLYPWFVSVPHEDVNFETNSWEVRDSEKLKLDESYKRISAVLDRVEKTLLKWAEQGVVLGSLPQPQLFVTGHTDTVGGDNDNVVLSRNRAKAIATYFRQKGFRMPIYFVGYGERTPRVHTGDNVDEIRNRRADYQMMLQPPPTLTGTGWTKL
ncbi:MAG TPA: OmpA family protein [Pseudomonadota bacterium]|nr:OmpA family protein [Pseudomonadota bacterium]